jgi:ADP-ribose pyrophosphatase
MKLSEETLASTQVLQGNFLQVFRDDVRLPNGKAATREYVKHPGAVVIVAH